MDDQIKNGRMTIRDVAKALNVSPATVSRALSGKGRISGETVQRVQTFIKENNYVPNAIAQSLADQRTYNIGFIMPRGESITDHSFFYACLTGVFWALSDTVYDVLVVMNEDDSEQHLARALERGKLDGAIVSRSRVDDQAARLLREAGVPFVLIGSSKDEGIFRVDHDHRAACGELTKILLDQNKELALLGGDQRLLVTQDRLQGFLDAYQSVRLTVGDGRLYFDLDTRESMEAAVDGALAAGANCLICMDDWICSAVLPILRRKGFRIPQDIQLASFYDSYVLEHTVPGITALSLQAEDLGVAACRLLMDLMAGKNPERKLTVGYEIVLRGSTNTK